MAEQVTAVLFGDSNLGSLDAAALEVLKSAAPSFKVSKGSLVVDALVASGLANSKSAARRSIEQKAVAVNEELVADDERRFLIGDFLNGMALLKRGKKNVALLVLM